MNHHGGFDLIPKLRPGDTLYLKEGVYIDPVPPIPSGESCDKPVRISAAGWVTLRPSSLRVLDFAGAHHIEVANIIIDAVNCSSDCVQIGPVSFDGEKGIVKGPSHHIRLVNCEITRSSRQGVLIVPECDDNELIDCRIHHNGSTNQHHGVYCESHRNRIERCDISNNTGWGIHCYNGYTKFWRTGNNLFVGNRCWGNGVGKNCSGAGIGIYRGAGNEARGNACFGNAVGIALDYGADKTVVVGNRAWRNRLDYYDGDGATNTDEHDNRWG